jgi:hypothetical protein
MSASTLLLAPHAHFCVDGDYCIFLDLKNDGYLCIERRDIEVLQRSAQPSSATSMTLADELVRSGLFTTSASCGRPIAPTHATTARRALVAEAESRGTARALRGLARFVRSSILAHTALTNWQLRRTVEFVRRRRAGLSTSAPDPTALARLVGEYTRWRPFFPRPYLCLFDSLGLFEFLAQHDVGVDWVYGVQAEPFEAHCWLQIGDIVVNDSVEHVSPFTPIMVV